MAPRRGPDDRATTGADTVAPSGQETGLQGSVELQRWILLFNLLADKNVDVWVGVRVISEIESSAYPLLENTGAAFRPEGLDVLLDQKNLLQLRMMGVNAASNFD